MLEILSVLLIAFDVLPDEKIDYMLSFYAYSFLITFTVVVTIIFYANPWSGSWNKRAVLSNLSTLSALLLGLLLSRGWERKLSVSSSVPARVTF